MNTSEKVPSNSSVKTQTQIFWKTYPHHPFQLLLKFEEILDIIKKKFNRFHYIKKQTFCTNKTHNKIIQKRYM